MKTRSLVVAIALVATVAAPLTVAPAPPSAAAAETCNGQAATIVGTPKGDITGTPGPDVIVTNGAWSVHSGAGADLICTTSSTPRDGYAVQVRSGPGKDLIDRRDDLDPTANALLVGQQGEDTVFGGPGEDLIVITDGDHDVIDAGGGHDNVGGPDSTTPEDDEVDLGPGDDFFGVPPLTASSMHVIGGDGNDSFYLTASTRGTWLVDSRAGVLSKDQTLGLSFEGFESFWVYSPVRARVRFLGSDAPEFLRVEPTKSMDGADLGGGDDRLVLVGWGSRSTSRPARAPLVGGEGRDWLYLYHDRDSHITVDLDRERLSFVQGAPPKSRSSVSGFEDIGAYGGRVSLTGDAGPNTLDWWGCSGGSVRGKGGADVIRWYNDEPGTCGGGARLRAAGNSGDDLLQGGPIADRLIGGPGVDVARGGTGHDICEAETAVSCRPPRP